MTVPVKILNVGELLEKYRADFEKVAPAHLSIDRLFRLAVSIHSRQPRLAECTPESFLSALLYTAQVGLDIGPGGVHLVPFKNGRTGRYEVTAITDYRGLMELARRAAGVHCEAEVVHAHDSFSWEYGTDAFLHHTPVLSENNSEVIAAWAMATFADGRKQFRVVDRKTLDKHRAFSKASGDGPWAFWFEPMACKTAVRILCDFLPQSPELRTALDHESDVILHPTETSSSGTQSRRLAAHLESKRSTQQKNSTGFDQTPKPVETLEEESPSAPEPMLNDQTETPESPETGLETPETPDTPHDGLYTNMKLTAVKTVRSGTKIFYVAILQHPDGRTSEAVTFDPGIRQYEHRQMDVVLAQKKNKKGRTFLSLVEYTVIV